MIQHACLFASALALTVPALGDGRARPSVRRLTPQVAPTVAPGDVSAALSIISSTPASGAIDARQPSDIDGTSTAGWQSLTMTFNGNSTQLTASDFVVTQQGGLGVAPAITGLTHIDATTVRVDFSAQINPGAWTTVTSGAAQVRLGYLPGDVNGDGFTSNLDTLLLIDAINGVVNLPLRAVDMDRSGALTQTDLSRLAALLHGSGGIYATWQGRTLPGFTKSNSIGNIGGVGLGGPITGTGTGLNVVLTHDYTGDCADSGDTATVTVAVQRTEPGAPINIRGLQFDTLLTDGGLTVDLPLTHSVPTGDIFFWDFTTQGICDIVDSLCGSQHFIVDDLGDNPLLSITFTGQAQDDINQLIIPGDGTPLVLGNMEMTAPDGSYNVNAVNGDETNENLGFYLVFGFGGDGDPVTTWRVDTGQAGGGSHDICFGGAVVCVPEDCDDGDDCNGIETCNVDTNECEAGTPLDCDDGIDCTADSCVDSACVNDPDDGACDDGLFCTGTETCGTAGCESSGDPCDPLTCNEDTDLCEGCLTDADCDDADGCNGLETCDAGDCIPGTPLNCDDGIDCTDDSCADDACVNDPNDGACDDGAFCTGTETCGDNGCESSGDPCDDGETCNEDTDECDGPIVCIPEDCDDDLFCNGQEVCDGDVCLDGDPVQCPDGQVCNETADECVDVDDNKITLNPDSSCYGFGDVVTMTVDFTSTELVVGAQVFLAYDSIALDFVSAVPNDPWSVEIFESVNEAAGTIDYAVHVPFNPPGEGANAGSLATITFVANQDMCGETSVDCRENNPPTRLTTNGGLDIEPACNAGVINIIPPIAECPHDLDVNADAGVCSAHVCWGLGMNECTGGTPDVCTAVHETAGEIALDGTCGDFPSGVTTITCGEGAGGCAGGGSCEWTITVSDENTVTSELQLSPIVESGPFDRCITWEIYPDDCGDPLIISDVVTFGQPNNIPGHGTYEAKVPCGDYTCTTARDSLHTLRSVAEAEVIEEEVSDGMYEYTRLVYFLEYKGDPEVGGNWLTGGNLNDDCVIDILDFGVFLGEFGADYGSGDTDCSTEAPHADINGDGLVDDTDYGFIEGNFLEVNKENCCGAVADGCNPPGGGGQTTQALIIDNKGRVLSTPVTPKLQRADLNGDGVLDFADFELFQAGERPAPKGKVRDRDAGSRR
jgi:hypothetical protein